MIKKIGSILFGAVLLSSAAGFANAGGLEDLLKLLPHPELNFSDHDADRRAA